MTAKADGGPRVPGWSPRLRYAALAGVALLGLVAFAVGVRDRSPSAAPDPEVGRLRAAAALPACPPGLGPELPGLLLPCLGGGPDVALRARGTSLPTVVNVWGSWCAPCLKEVPELIDFAGRAAGRVALVGVNSSDDERSALSFAAQAGMNYPSLVDANGTVSRAYGQGTPKTLFLDSQGRIAHVKIGGFRDLGELRDLTRTHLGVQV